MDSIARIHTGAKTLEIPFSGETTLHALIAGAGLYFDAPCGGKGTCGKCRVRVSGEVLPMDERERKLLGKAAAGERLACRCKAVGSVEITLADDGDAAVEIGAVHAEYPLSPTLRAVTVALREATLASPVDDQTALLEATGAASLSLTAARKLPELSRQHGRRVCAVLLSGRVVDVLAPGEEQRPVAMAVDVGTTTIAAYFCRVSDGTVLQVRAGVNLQRAFGADVISRIQYAMEGGLETLRAAIVGQLGDMLAAFSRETGTDPARVYQLVLAGNTVMGHLAAGITPRYIANAPFIPGTKFGGSYSMRALGFSGAPEGEVYIAPSVAAYVGGDITSGMISCGLDALPGRNLYIDIGTNGEIALCDNGRFFCCATAAGPAFEGAHIECGMGGVPGAVSRVSVENGRIAAEVIGGGAARGVCGSGLIDAVAAMLALGVIDETGRFCDEDEEAYGKYVRLRGGEPVFALTDGVYITPKDVREVQLAKAAVMAGINTLLNRAGLGVDALERVVIAGGFGAHIDKNSAMKIGLLPRVPESRVISAGNASGAGAVRAALCGEAARAMERLAGKMEYIELSGDPYFQNEYVMQMMFGEE